ncbi:MAG: hypothetical protein M1828_003401 [Chrysothrix sp. TS-e1954]|nr:MAG: hypothetical protein M1828_003401 [Chrysothrix sp. TS-e1954]
MTAKDESSSIGRSDAEVPLVLPKVRGSERVASGRPLSELSLPFRRSNSSLAALFASTSGSITPKRASSPIVGSTPGSHGTPPRLGPYRDDGPQATNDYVDLIVRSFAPHIALLPSADTEELLAQKGFQGGLLQLFRPFGEQVPGKVTIRDSAGSSKSWENFAVHFTRMKDGLESPRIPSDATKTTQNIDGYLDQLLPQSSSRLRTGGDVLYVDENVEKHMSYLDVQGLPAAEDEELAESSVQKEQTKQLFSPFHLLYLRRILSGLPVTPHETFSQPVTAVLAISSRSPDPIDELRSLYALTRTGNERLPEWASNEYLRYYLLIHDEEHDDPQRSHGIFEQMKRHFGLHCHMLRLRSSQCVPSDDDCVRLPMCEWLSAAEELSEIQRREGLGDLEDAGTYLYESDHSAIKTFIRELVTQSVIPVMERSCATWNDQIVSRRRGISGRFLSLSKKWTPFGSSSRNSSSSLGMGAGTGNTSPTSSGTNYDPQNGTYRSDASEALMRRLADHAVMLRDFKLAHSIYEMLRTDFTNDKAWRYHAGACEMSALTSLLLHPSPAAAKSRNDSASIDSLLDTAVTEYYSTCDSPFAALRCLVVAVELLAAREGQRTDDAAQWACRILDLNLVASVGHRLFTERIAMLYDSREGVGSVDLGSRNRKAAFWYLQVARIWLDLGHKAQAEATLEEVWRLYKLGQEDEARFTFANMKEYLLQLRNEVAGDDVEHVNLAEPGSAIRETHDADSMTLTTPTAAPMEETSEALDVKSKRKSMLEPRPEPSEKPDIRTHRKTGSLIGFSTAPTDPLGVSGRPESRSPAREERS